MGMMIHDSREKARNSSTIIAKRGVIVAADEGHQVIVYDGSRQEYDSRTKTLHKLNFERYTIDLPDGGTVRLRWREPEERTIYELLHPDLESKRDSENLRNFKIEIHRRVTTPLLTIAFALISCCVLFLGPVDRRGQGRRITIAIISVIIIEGVYLSSFNISRQSDWGMPFMYVLVFVPIISCGLLLSGFGERLRRKFLYKAPYKTEGVS